MGVTQPTRGREGERGGETERERETETERERMGNREKTAKMGKSTLLTFLGTRIHGAVFQFYHSQLVSFFSSPPTLPIANHLFLIQTQ